MVSVGVVFGDFWWICLVFGGSFLALLGPYWPLLGPCWPEYVLLVFCNETLQQLWPRSSALMSTCRGQCDGTITIPYDPLKGR